MNKEEIETGVSHIAYFRTDGGSPRLYTEEYVEEKDKEIERLNNIINELEKYVIDKEKHSWIDNGAYNNVLDKLKELKEGKE